MKISIITPSFNQARFIERTIQSVLSQNYPDLEYIVMDGGSTDGTIEILKKYEGKIIWKSEKDNGQSDAINKGLEMATGDIVTYLNSDDTYEPEALKKVAEFFQRNPDRKWVYGKCKIINGNDQEIRKLITFYKNLLLKKFSCAKLLSENFISQPATFWKREIHSEIGFFDENEHYCMDYEFWLRIGKKYPAGVIDAYLANFRYYANSKSGGVNKKQFQDELRLAKKYGINNKLSIVLHYLNYWKITISYWLMNIFNNEKMSAQGAMPAGRQRSALGGKKVLFLFPHFLLPGGAANSTVRFARALNEKGYTTEIICAGISDDFAKENSDLKFTILDIPTSGTLFYWVLFPFWKMKINKKLEEYSDYIFFPQVLPSNWWAWIFKLTHKNQKIIWNCNEPSAFIHSKTWIRAIKNPLMRCGAIILNPLLKKIDISLEKQNNFVFCNSNYSASDYEKSYHKKPNAVIYPPSYIKINSLSSNKQNYIFTVSRLSKFKNVDLLIDTFEDISAKFPAYSLLIAGEGEHRQILEKIAQEKKLEARIKFLGKVSNEKLEKLYKDARVTVLCSKNEPFGLVPVESMMHGTPVIAHKSGGPMETILSNETGFLYEQDTDLPIFLEKIINLNDEKYKEMQIASQEQAKKFDISNLITKLENIINSI